MNIDFFKPAWLCAALAFAPVAAHGQSAPEAPLAEVGIAARMVALAQNPGENAFELGFLSTLRAVEKTLQTRYHYGLGDRITGLPLLRLSFDSRQNSDPEPSRPDTVSRMIDTFVQDMDQTQTILAGAQRNGVRAFDLELQDLWFDVDRNGLRDPGEDATNILAPVLLDARTRRDLRNANGLDTPIRVHFDAADHAWLSAYTHMLAGMGNAFLAFDPTPVIAALDTARKTLKDAPTLPNFYDQKAVKAEIAALEAEREVIKQRQTELRTMQKPVDARIRALNAERRLPANKGRREEFDAQIKALRDLNQPFREESSDLSRNSRFLRNEIRSARGKLTIPKPDRGPGMEKMAKLRNQAQEENRALRREIAENDKNIKALHSRSAQATSASTRAQIAARLDAAQATARKLQGDLRKNDRMRKAIARALLKERLGRDRPGCADAAQTARPFVDLLFIALKALEQQPDPARIRAAHENWLNMIAFNRMFWAALDAETDNEAEWIPNPRQTSALGIEVGADVARAWQNILADAEAVLQGRLLLPHPLLPDGYGISLAAYVHDPGPIDLIAWIQGIGAYPYAARGPRITTQTWQAFSRLTQGRAGMFSLYFN